MANLKIGYLAVVVLLTAACAGGSNTEPATTAASTAVVAISSTSTTAPAASSTTTTLAPAASPIVGHDGCVVTTPPAELELDPFYSKYCDAAGIPIISSSAVPDEALGRAWNIITNLLAPLPDVQRALADAGQYFAVMAQSEVTTDIPEYRYLADDPVTNWDERARGLGGYPFSSGAEENLMCYPDDPYLGESIALHEFAHTIDDGMDFVDTSFDGQLADAYAAAMSAGLWANTYAANNAKEYWAEGVQSYFDTNIERSPSDGIHNEVNTRSELADYDPHLFALIDSMFGGFEWSPTCDNL
ncbi:MAG: hypothetical protein K8R99_03505 [Actinomycetia bacterium]|nr:hypothetical protein [Actinomycetes bacterium]